MKNEPKPITIGVLAKQANVGVETVRFYERKGLLVQPQKTGGFRHYKSEDVRRIRLIKRMQEIGFTLEEIKDLLALGKCNSGTRDVIKQKSSVKIRDIKQKIEDLTLALNAIETFAQSCGSVSDSALECNLYDCFENEWQCCNRATKTRAC